MENIGTIDMFQYHQLYTPGRFITYNDTTVIAVGQYAVSFWDISDPANWVNINVYNPGSVLVVHNAACVQSSNLFLLRADGIEMLDISNPEDIVLVDFIEIINQLYDLILFESNIYVSTYREGIKHYGFTDYEMFFIENIYEYPAWYSSHLYMNYLFLETFSNIVYLFNLENPDEPEPLGVVFSDSMVAHMSAFENRLVLKDYVNFLFKIYDISEPENPVLQNIIEANNIDEMYYTFVYFDNSIENLYLFYRSSSFLKKYDISETMSPELLFEYSDISAEKVVINNAIAYMLEDIDSHQNLHIIAGLNDNQPYLHNTIINFTNYDSSPTIKILNNYLCTRTSPNYSNSFYNLADPFSPECQFGLDIPSTQSFPLFFEDYIFTKTDNFSYIYEINENSNGYIDPIDSLVMLAFIEDIIMMDYSDSIKYLIVTQISNVAIFEIEYEDNSADDEVLFEEDYNLNNFPNPFSKNTTISYDLTEVDKENGVIYIYNIKGQKIRKLLFDNRESAIIWNATDEYGKAVSNGVYFYKLNVNNETKAVRKMILLR